MDKREDLRIYALAAQFCYFDTGSDYGKWKLNHGDYDDHFNALFKRLVKPPRKIEFVDRRLGYFIGLIETRNETIIVCPGTRKSFQGLQDLDADFDLTATETTTLGFECKIHRGFLERYHTLRDELIDIVSKLHSHTCNKPLRLVGHSLGGVLAILLSVELNERKIRKTPVVSFGTPKFGCDRIRQRIRQTGLNIIRISNLNDPMVHLVPYGEFEYVGREIIVAEYDKTWTILYVLTMPLLLYAMSVSFCGFVILLLLISLHGCALTHSMVRYAEVLDRNQNQSNSSTLTTATRFCLHIPIFYVFLLSYLFTIKKFVNKVLWG